jgi:monoamine oxidase
MRHVDVVVIGAGIAGLTAARDLASAERSVLVLEARGRVGGRTAGHTLRSGAIVEMGGAYVGPYQTAVLELIDELGLTIYPTYDNGDGLTRIGGITYRFSDESFGLPEESQPAKQRLWEALEALAETVSLESPWQTEEADDLDRQTFDAWLTATTSDEIVLAFYRATIADLFCREAWEMSLLHVLFYVKSSGMFGNMVATTGGNQESRIAGGSHRISERIAEELGDDVVRLTTPVHAIAQRGDGVTVSYQGGEIAAERVIVTLPPALAGRLRYSPPLPAARDLLTQQMPMGSVIKAQVAYDTPFWRDDGLSGFVHSPDGPVSFTIDGSPKDGSSGVMTCFIAGKHGRELSAMPDEQRRQLVIDTLVTYFGPRAAEPVEYVEMDWSKEEYTRGCYGGQLGAGVWTAYGSVLAEPVGRIHWAGTETASISNGYMDGAVRSGQRAATEVLAMLPVATSV